MNMLARNSIFDSRKTWKLRDNAVSSVFKDGPNRLLVVQLPIVPAVGFENPEVAYHWEMCPNFCRRPLQFANCVEPLAFSVVFDAVTVNGVPVRSVETASNCQPPSIAEPIPLVR